MAPRFSIIPGRFVEDDRPDLNHYKTLNALGRHTDDDGWCRVKQGNIGKAIGLSRESVCRKLRDLVEWGYVQKEDEDGSGRAIWYRILHDAPVKPPKLQAVSKPIEPSLPVKPASQVAELHAPTCEEQITPGVKTANHTRCDAQASQHNDPYQRSLLTTLPPSPHEPGANPVGGGGKRSGQVEWIEDLRAEGCAPLVLDGLLARLVSGGLATWKGLDGQTIDPRGPGRELCTELADDTAEVIEAVRDAAQQTARYRIPPVSDLISRAASARAAVAQRDAQRRALASLRAVPVDTAATTRFLDALRHVAPPEHVAAWFDPSGVVAVRNAGDGDPVLTIVTPYPPGIVGKQADSYARAAARMAWSNGHAEVEFVQGRAAA